MKDREAIQTLVDGFKQNPDFTAKHLGKCLEDLWLRGEFRMASLSGEFRNNPNPPRQAEALGITIIRGDRLQMAVFPIEGYDEKLVREKGEILDEVVGLAWEGSDPQSRRIASLEAVHNKAVEIAEARSLSTLAGIQISRSRQSGNRLMEILHPKFFRDVAVATDSTLQGAILDEVALTIALYFLSKGKFGTAQRTFDH